MMHSSSFIGVLIVGVGGFIVLTNWEASRPKTKLFGYLIAVAGAAVLTAGVLWWE
jgi:hypothetical protein